MCRRLGRAQTGGNGPSRATKEKVKESLRKRFAILEDEKKGKWQTKAHSERTERRGKQAVQRRLGPGKKRGAGRSGEGQWEATEVLCRMTGTAERRGRGDTWPLERAAWPRCQRELKGFRFKNQRRTHSSERKPHKTYDYGFQNTGHGKQKPGTPRGRKPRGQCCRHPAFRLRRRQGVEWAEDAW